MIEDELLKWRFKYGNQDALRRIYEKYLDYLLTLAMPLSDDASAAEDIVHDVFVSFAESADDFRLRGSLRGYLATCVINRARDRIRVNQRRTISPIESDTIIAKTGPPDQSVIGSEESQRLNNAIAQLPYEQREVITLRLKGGVKFRDIAKLQGVSINTIQGRYRYALKRLRSILNGEVEE